MHLSAAIPGVTAGNSWAFEEQRLQIPPPPKNNISPQNLPLSPPPRDTLVASSKLLKIGIERIIDILVKGPFALLAKDG